MEEIEALYSIASLVDKRFYFNDKTSTKEKFFETMSNIAASIENIGIARANQNQNNNFEPIFEWLDLESQLSDEHFQEISINDYWNKYANGQAKTIENSIYAFIYSDISDYLKTNYELTKILDIKKTDVFSYSIWFEGIDLPTVNINGSEQYIFIKN